MRRAVPVVVAVAALAASAVGGTSPSRHAAFPRPEAPAAPAPPEPSPTSTWDGGEPKNHDDVVSAYAVLAPGVPRDVVARRVALQAPRKELHEEIYPDPTYATARYDYATGLWHLFGTDQARLDAWAARARAVGIDPATHLVRYSRDELQDRVARIREGRDPLSRFSVLASDDVEASVVYVKVLYVRPDVEDDMVVWVDYGGAFYPELRPG